MSRLCVVFAYVLLTFGRIAFGANSNFPCKAPEAASNSQQPIPLLFERQDDSLRLRLPHSQPLRTEIIDHNLIIEALKRLSTAISLKNHDTLRAAIYNFQRLKCPIYGAQHKDIDRLDKYGNSLLHHAVAGDDAEAVTMLIFEAGASPLVLNNNTAIPLHYAHSLKMLETLSALPNFDIMLTMSDRHACRPLDKLIHSCGSAAIIQMVPLSDRYQHYLYRESLIPRHGNELILSIDHHTDTLVNALHLWKECRPTARSRRTVTLGTLGPLRAGQTASTWLAACIATLSSEEFLIKVAVTHEEISAFVGFIMAEAILAGMNLPELADSIMLSEHSFVLVLTQNEHFDREAQTMTPVVRAYIQEIRSLLDVGTMAQLLLPAEMHKLTTAARH
jgi:hypothetical protein